MKQFQWPLQRFLDVTVQKEQAAEAEIGRLNGEIRVRQDRIAQMERELAEGAADLRRDQLLRRMHRQELFMRFVACQKQKIAGLNEEIGRFEAEKKKKMQEYMDIRRSRKTLERLRDQAKDRHGREVRQFEQLQTDEAASLSFARQLQRTSTQGGR